MFYSIKITLLFNLACVLGNVWAPSARMQQQCNQKQKVGHANNTQSIHHPIRRKMASITMQTTPLSYCWAFVDCFRVPFVRRAAIIKNKEKR